MSSEALRLTWVKLSFCWLCLRFIASAIPVVFQCPPSTSTKIVCKTTWTITSPVILYSSNRLIPLFFLLAGPHSPFLLFNMLNIILLMITLFSTVVPASFHKLQTVDHLNRLPPTWHESKPADPAHNLRLSIALQKDNHVAEVLYNISTPGHAQYGQHLTQEEAQSLLSPDAPSHEAIITWLIRSNVAPADIKTDGHWIRFLTTIANANTMLAADFKWYSSSKMDKEVLRTMKYSVPRDLHSKISVISPTTRFCSVKMESMPKVQHHKQPQPHHTDLRKKAYLGTRATVETLCPVNRTVTPDCIRALYNVPPNITLSTSRGLGVYGSQDQVAKFSDFSLFTKNVDLKSTAVCHASYPIMILCY